MLMPDRIIELLNENQVGYEMVHHYEAFTAQELAEVEHVKGHTHAKVVLVLCGGEPLMLVLPSDHRVDLEKLENLFQKPSAIEAEEDLHSLFPDCAVGKMPPFGNLYGIPTVIDRALTENEWIVFEAGTHTDAIKMRMSDYLKLAGGTIADVSEKLQPMRTM